MRKLKSLKPFFVDTWDRHRKVIIICAAALVAAAACLIVALLMPAEPDSAKAAQESGADIPVYGIAGAEALASDPAADAEKRDEMAKRMEEIYDYLVQLDTMVTDNQTTLETVRQQTDAELAEGESMSDVQEKLQGDVVHLGTRMSDLHEEITTTRELLLLLKDATEKGQQQSIESAQQSFSQVESSIQSIGQGVEGAIADVSSLIEKFRSEDATGHQTVIETLTTVKTSLQSAQTENYNAMKEQLGSMKEEYLQTASRMQESINGEIRETRDAVSTDIGNLDSRMGNRLDGLGSSMDESFTGLKGDVNSRFDGLGSSMDENFTGLKGDVNSRFDGLGSSMDESFTGLKGDVNSRFDGLGSSMNESFTGLKGDMNTRFGGLEQSLTNVNNDFTTNFTTLNTKVANGNKEILDRLKTCEESLDSYRSSVDSYLQGADASFRSVADGKKLLANTLATKGQVVGETATFREIADAIEQLQQTIVIENIPNVGISYVYHHHTLGTVGDADNWDKDAATYADGYTSNSAGGCFCTVNTHTHSSSCYGPAHGNGVPCGGTIVDLWYDGEQTFGHCSRCGAGWQDWGAWGDIYGRTPTCSREGEARDLICGISEGQTWYTRSCGLAEGQIVSAHIQFY